MLIKTHAINEYRKRIKIRIVESMGGKCNICGYSKCIEALELHHINPEEKDYDFGSIRDNHNSWEKIVIELRKCVLLCANCHREFHAGILVLPEKLYVFNELYADYKSIEQKTDFDICPVCGGLKYKWNKTCSSRCGGKLQNTIKWNNEDLIRMYSEKKSLREIGRYFNASEKSVKNRLIKLNIVI